MCSVRSEASPSDSADLMNVRASSWAAQVGRAGLWLFVVVACLIGMSLAIVHVADGLVATTVRNTVLYEFTKALPAWLQPPDPATEPMGSLVGTVADDSGRPLANASVIVADRRGVTYRAVTDDHGRYQ